MTSTRRIVVGLDGTWNEPETTGPGEVSGTNVVDFVLALTKRDQIYHYEQGVGTRSWEALPGGLYGYGLEKTVLGGYRFIARSLRDRRWKGAAKKIFIVGFSRGAYAARRLAGVIAHSGVPTQRGDEQLGWEMYVEKDRLSAARLLREGRFAEAEIEMLGVWDTVKATNDRDYEDNLLSSNVVAGYHAMAIDERRKPFPVMRWRRESRVNETWFAGVHADVGGGYAQKGLAHIPLQWMMKCAYTHGLKFSASYVRDKLRPNVRGVLHDSFTGIYKPLGARVRKIRATDVIHASVLRRMQPQTSTYRPSNLPPEPRYAT